MNVLYVSWRKKSLNYTRRNFEVALDWTTSFKITITFQSRTYMDIVVDPRMILFIYMHSSNAIQVFIHAADWPYLVLTRWVYGANHYMLITLISWRAHIAEYILYNLIVLYSTLTWPDITIIQDMCTIVEAIELKQGYSGVVQSPGYPDDYTNNLAKRWRIIVPSGSVSLSISIYHVDILQQSTWKL